MSSITAKKCDLCGTISEHPMPYTHKYEALGLVGIARAINTARTTDVCVSCCNILAEAIDRRLVILSPDAPLLRQSG